jgi:hypothetical protein
MKKLIASLLTAAAFVAPVAHAADIATMPNRDGGLIVLTDVVGVCTSGRRFYITGGAGAVLAGGCYTIADPWVTVKYDIETSLRYYPSANFSLTPLGRSYANRASAPSM